ncbi:MAG: PAS domain S-box protein [Nitrospirae bacterium]|nr:PAS domain S-box protein [Nitrospirota bacterium]
MNISLLWLQNNLDIVYFIYGLAFILMGIIILVQPRKESSFKISEILWLLAGFGIVHGISEWLHMWVIIKGSNTSMDFIRWVSLILSYIFIFEFGRRLIRLTSIGSSHCQLMASHYLFWWLSPIIMLIILFFGIISFDFLKVVTIWSRYLFGFFGSMFTAFGFYFYYRCNKELFEHLLLKKYFMWSSLVFMIYGILGGIIVQKGEFFPSNVVNAESFLMNVHIPVQVFRGILAITSAISIGGILKIFNWEQRRKLQQSIDDWTNTFISISDFVSVHDLDYRIVKVNKSLSDFLKKQPNDLIGRHCYDVLHNTKVPWVSCPHSETIRQKKAVTEIVNDTNVGFPMMVTTSPLFDADGRMLGSVHIAKDISESVKQKERDKVFINTSIDGFSVMDRAGRFIDVNDAYCSLYGYSREEILNMNLSDFEVLEKTQDIDSHMKRIIGMGSDRFETLHRCIDGSIKDVEISVSYLKDGEVFFSFIRDITERKKLMDELLELNQNLEKRIAEEVEQNKLKDRLMSEQFHQLAIDELMVNIAHQWRQPLNAIGLMVQNIRDDFNFKELTDSSLNSSVMIIMDELFKLSMTIKTFTNSYSQYENEQEINVSQAIKMGINSMKEQFISNNVLVDTSIEDNILAKGYSNILTQVTITIIENSLEVFIERNIKNRYIKITASKDTLSNKIIISISDNGGGIDKTILDKIFDPYFTTKFKSRGRGMSLYLVKTMIERKMEGSMRLSNTKEGVEFIIEVCCYGSE